MSNAPDEDVLFEANDDPPFLVQGTAVVEAKCVAVTRAFYFGRPKLVFRFNVIKPEMYCGRKLEMYVRNASHWKGHPPRSSKLWKITCEALGRFPEKRERVTKKMFLNKIFQCEVATSGKGATSYSVVKRIIGIEK